MIICHTVRFGKFFTCQTKIDIPTFEHEYLNFRSVNKSDDESYPESERVITSLCAHLYLAPRCEIQRRNKALL